jgi:hypothetical protein
MLSAQKQMLFALYCANRVLPIYIKWATIKGRNHPSAKPRLVATIVNTLWEIFEGRTDKQSYLNELLSKASSLVAPSEEESSSFESIGAISCIESAIACISNEDILENAVWAAIGALKASDTIPDNIILSPDMPPQEQYEYNRKRITDSQYPLAREWAHLQTIINILKVSEDNITTQSGLYTLLEKHGLQT